MSPPSLLLDASTTPQYTSLNQILDPQSILKIADINGMGVKVYASSYSASKLDDISAFVYKLNGKRYAVLINTESFLSDINGISRFKNLQIIDTTDQIVYIYFASNGIAKECSTLRNYNSMLPLYSHPIIANKNN